MAPAGARSRARICTAEACDDRSNDAFNCSGLREFAYAITSISPDDQIGECGIERPPTRRDFFHFFDDTASRERRAVACFDAQSRSKYIERGIEKDDVCAAFATCTSDEVCRTRRGRRPATKGENARSCGKHFLQRFRFRGAKRVFAEAAEGLSSGGGAQTRRRSFIEIGAWRTQSRRQCASKR